MPTHYIYIRVFVCGMKHSFIHQYSKQNKAKKMALTISTTSASASATATAITLVVISFLLVLPTTSYCSKSSRIKCDNLTKSDIDLLEFPLNLEYLEAEFFLWGSLGHGLDKIAPDLTMDGPSPIGVKKANLDNFTRDVILQFALQEVGHLRAIKSNVRGFPRPLLNLSAATFEDVMCSAFGKHFKPAFNPYANSLNFLIASYIIPYVGLTGYVGANPKLKSYTAKKLVAGLLAVESGQDAVIRGMLYQRALEEVEPYGITVAEFTKQISELRNKLGKKGKKDEGLIVSKQEGAEGKIKGNVLAADQCSLGYDRTPEEILRIVYGGGGKENVPGGFYPEGAGGRIAKSLLNSA